MWCIWEKPIAHGGIERRSGSVKERHVDVDELFLDSQAMDARSVSALDPITASKALDARS